MKNQDDPYKQKETRVLIIEDNHDDFIAYGRMLKFENDTASYVVEGASTGKEGMNMLAENSYDCILLDFNLPDDNGYSFLSNALAAFSPCPPIIIMTGQGNDSQGQECLVNGAAEYLIKDTVSADSLRHSITTALIKTELEHQVMDMKSLTSQDTLTGLFNRFEFESRIEKRITEHPEEYFSVFFIDIDFFKRVNDLYGHNIGDNVLIESSKRLSALFPDAEISRIGGDEFGMIYPGCSTAKSALQKGLEISQILGEENIPSADISIKCSASVGIALYPESATSKVDLMKYADLAKESAKSSKRGTAILYSEELFKLFERKANIENAISRALEDHEFRMVYQPVYDANTNKMVSVEALIRWDHPSMGSISPAEFIPIAEETNTIVDIGYFVIKETFTQLSKWHENEALKNIKLSINVSPTQLKDINFLEHLTEAVNETGIDPTMVYIEITETAVVDPEAVLDVLAGLTKSGFTLAIDDFGTGNSSLLILSELPVSILKIDQSYVKRVNESEGKNRLIKSIISIADNFTMMTIAEGVRNQGQLDFLMENGCSLIQGSIYSMPVRPTEIYSMLELTPSVKEF